MKKTATIISILGIMIFISSCNTIKYIPEDKTPAQIIQMGQNASTATAYKSAIYCYETVIERFGSNPAILTEAQYEIGYVYLKQKKYDKAYTAFTDLLQLYDTMGSSVPPAYKKLAEIGIEKIPARYKKAQAE
ncbi:MAG: tetratricopeptide repeat protein [Treponema sp.]|nr:tetratricopeptide repeat protein [Treponema sp.]